VCKRNTLETQLWEINRVSYRNSLMQIFYTRDLIDCLLSICQINEMTSEENLRVYRDKENKGKFYFISLVM